MSMRKKRASPFRLSIRVLHTLHVRLLAEHKRLCIEISDTGTGILPNDINHIFDPYFTTKGHGTGLGLATVHKIIEAHGGEITVQSRHKSQGGDPGTTFRIYLPVAPDAPTEPHHE